MVSDWVIVALSGWCSFVSDEPRVGKECGHGHAKLAATAGGAVRYLSGVIALAILSLADAAVIRQYDGELSTSFRGVTTTRR